MFLRRSAILLAAASLLLSACDLGSGKTDDTSPSLETCADVESAFDEETTQIRSCTEASNPRERASRRCC